MKEFKVGSIVRIPRFGDSVTGKIIGIIHHSDICALYHIQLEKIGFAIASCDELCLVEDPHFIPVKTIYQKPATIMFFADGTKEVVVAQKGDRYSKVTGTLLCMFKRQLERETYNKVVLKAFDQLQKNK